MKILTALAVSVAMTLSAAAQADLPTLETGPQGAQCSVSFVQMKTDPGVTRIVVDCDPVVKLPGLENFPGFGADVEVDEFGRAKIIYLRGKVQDCRDPLRSNGPSSPPIGSYSSADPSQPPC